MIESYATNLLISILLGAAIGLERQSSRLEDADDLSGSGIRTFSLVGLLGCLSSIFYLNNFPLIFALMSAGFLILLCTHYAIEAIHTKNFGFTTEVSGLLTYLIGVCCGMNLLPLQLTIAIAVVIVVILSLKSRSEKLLSVVSRKEVESFIIFAILALVILPFLSDHPFTVADVPLLKTFLEGAKIDYARFESLELLNPQKLWFIVVLITGIELLGFVMSKFVGQERGQTFSSLVGGFVSSTLTTQSLAQQSKQQSNSNHLVGAAILANLASFFQIFLLVGPLNREWLGAIFPTLLVMIATASLISLYFLRMSVKSDPTDVDKQASESSEKRIFSLVPALQFALLLSLVKIVTNLCLILFGKAGFIVSSIIASFAGIDAILVNLAGMAGNSITFSFALFTFVLVNATNLLAKTFYCYLQGSREFTLKFLFSVLIIIASSFIGLLFV